MGDWSGIMKIGIITFHWGASHGGVLQSYATQKYLQYRGCDAYIINYCPRSLEITLLRALKPNYPRRMISNIETYIKNRRISSFRGKLSLSNRYNSHDELINDPPTADIYITGSDQVWNPYFLLHGEGGLTPSYFLDFARKETKKIALSVSFGCSMYEPEVADLVKNLIDDFKSISVRERSGQRIMKSLNYYGSTITADPTCLLSCDEYMKLCPSMIRPTGLVTYFLHCDKRIFAKLITEVQNTLNINKKTSINNVSVEKWISSISRADFVVTNSFHCLMFCLYFHKPFLVTLIDGSLSGMNDRIIDIIDFFGLDERMVLSTGSYTSVLVKDIDWVTVDMRMQQYRNTLINYIEDCVIDE